MSALAFPSHLTFIHYILLSNRKELKSKTFIEFSVTQKSSSTTYGLRYIKLFSSLRRQNVSKLVQNFPSLLA